MIQIDKNIPMPPPRNTQRKYPWDRMEVGDSFQTPQKGLVTIANKRYAPKKFLSRRVGSEYRVWRYE